MLKSIFAAITRVSLRFWVVTLVITALFLGAGVYAASQMNQELLPDLTFPQTFVITQRPGASSEDLLNLITIPLENEVISIGGVIPEGLETTTVSPVSVVIVRNNYGENQERLREQLEEAVKRVNEMGVPVGLKTTADLTPEIMTRVLTLAPSMFAQFDAAQLQAMPQEVLNAALAVDPNILQNVDVLTRDQLAASRVDEAVTAQVAAREPVALPAAWAITEAQQPSINSFDLSALPVTTLSISSSDPNLSPADLRAYVDKEIKERLEGEEIVAGLATVSVTGGQQIPGDILKAAQDSRANAQTATPAATATAATAESTPEATETAPVETDTPAVVVNGDSPLPDAWRNPLVALLLPGNIGFNLSFGKLDDLLNATDSSGAKKSGADVLNAIAGDQANAQLLGFFNRAQLDYLYTAEPTLLANLSEAALDQLTVNVLTSGTWTQLLNQPGFTAANVRTLRDVAKVKGSPSATLNAIVEGTPQSLNTFAIRTIAALSPEAITLFNKLEPDFLSKLSPATTRFLSPDVLKANAPFVETVSDAALKTELQAIITDPTKSPSAGLLTVVTTQATDPNAPPMPQVWTDALKTAGLNVVSAADLLNRPFGLSAGGFVSAVGARAANLLEALTPEILNYLQSKDANFFSELTPAVLGGLSAETFAALPPDVQARAERTAAFTPTTSITRANGRESLTLSFSKESDANTVNVSDEVDHFLEELQKERPDLQITRIFEQAEFIKESIGGVAREGGLGAVMAVVVILLFLNFSVRSTLVTAVSIPASVAIAFVLMRYLPGAVHTLLVNGNVNSPVLLRLFPEAITLNIMTLSGLTVAIGRVVDDSIVVLENIYRQFQHDTTASTRDVVITATRDVSVAIFAATLTTVVVFLPIGLTGGVVGEFFLPFGLAVTYSLIASFVVAITLVPVCAWLFIRRKDVPQEKEGRLEAGYHRLLEWALGHRWAMVGIGLATLVLGLYLFSTRPTTFIPSFGAPQISVAVSLPAGTKIAATDTRVRELEAYIDTLPDETILRYSTVIGTGGGLTALFSGGGVSENSATITLAARGDTEELNALTAQVRTEAERIFGRSAVRVSKASISEQGFGGFAVVVSGPEADLRALHPRIKEALGTVPGLTNVTGTFDQVGGAQAYLRINRTTAVQYTGELETENTLGVTDQAIVKVKALDNVPQGVTIGQGFQSQQQTEGFSQTFASMGIAIVIVYLVMVVTFGSLVHPFTILFSLPLAIVGAALGLTLTDRVLGLSALIGLLMLIGIVVTNAIVMIDRVQANRKERGMPTREALIEGARTRLRPILMTAIATIFALLPLAVGLSEGAIIASELGTVVIGGLFSSTVLTLLIVPVIYSLIDGVQRRLTGRDKA